MTLLSGENWSGNISTKKTLTATGQINGYAWFFQVKQRSWLVEIAEDQTIDASDLPLVGFGCGGWLYESSHCNLPENEQQQIEYIQQSLSQVFSAFHHNKLQYLPAVSCPCSE